MPGKRARRHFSQLNEFERGLIIGMKTAGWSTCRVAGQVDRSECAFRNCWEQWTREGTHAWKTGCGATRETTRRDDQRIVRKHCGPHSDSFNDTFRRRSSNCPQTISRYLAEANLKSKRPFRALPLTLEHRQPRLQWCQARSMWNVTDWKKVVFSDESRFVLGTDDNHVRVLRCPGPFLDGLPGTIFQQDNARPHTARVAQDFLRHFQTFPWPARSPNLSPVRVGSAKTADAIVSFCTCFRVGCSRFVGPSASGQHKVSNELNADRVAAYIAAGGGPTRY
ncbi:transposable element Tc1 transposase [Trichonephila clavipes]|nr:transposable element Tc1 transposase [Trichonephila clavipes]